MQTKSVEGTAAKDALLTITQASKKLGVNAFSYINERVSKKFKMLTLSDLIIENAMPQIVQIFLSPNHHDSDFVPQPSAESIAVVRMMLYVHPAATNIQS